MAEIKDGRGVKTIAYFLPQFHAIPENDRAWGKGFTEWTNTRKAEPLFEGHYQPKTPLNENYYNLLDDDVKIWQAELAKKYGIFGFCYYHYWFKDGKQLLEKPAEQMLANKAVDIPFCFSWANENWSKLWDGGSRELIAEQNYGGEPDWKKHLEYLVDFFRDERYITLDGKPVFLIYKPEEIPKVDKMLDFWNEEIKSYGFDGICFMIQNPQWFFMPSYDMGRFSYQIKFYPFFSTNLKRLSKETLQKRQSLYRKLKKVHLNFLIDKVLPKLKKSKAKPKAELTKLDYDEIWTLGLNSDADSRFIEGAFVDWDNTARKKNGYVHTGATPEKFGAYMSKLFKKVKDNRQQPVVFINAWNEWCEGAYLEPDTKHGYGYLEKFKEANDSQ